MNTIALILFFMAVFFILWNALFAFSKGENKTTFMVVPFMLLAAAVVAKYIGA